MEEVAKLGEMAVAVGEDHRELQETIRTEREEKARLLERVVEAVRPSLKAISGKILTVEEHSPGEEPMRGYLAGPNGRGVLVGVIDAVPKTGLPRLSLPSGKYSGKALYLSETGAFVELEYHGRVVEEVLGSCSRWAASTWETGDPAHVVAARWPVHEITKRLADVLEGHLRGKGTKRIIAVEQNVEKLRALSVLLRGIEEGWR